MDNMDDFFDKFRDEDYDPENTDLSSTGWSPDNAFDNLVQERSLHGISNKEVTVKLIEENAPLAVQSIVNLALRGKSERTRLDASKYLVDRSLGRIPESQINDGKRNPLDIFFDDIAEHANANQA